MAKSTGKPRAGRRESWTVIEPAEGNEQGLFLDLPPASNRSLTVAGAGVPAVQARDGLPMMSVSELSARIRGTLEGTFDQVAVTGEITGMRPAASGHVYFALKDSSAYINCVMWAREAGRQKALPKDGEEAEVEGRLGVYEPRGQYQLIVTSIRPAGMGRLHTEFLQLKERLERAGLFDGARKRPIPRTPAVVGLVTSPTGAALRDILAVLRRRAPGIRVVVWPARVQGEGAAQEIAAGVEFLGLHALAEVLIVGRGGGSMEDLWAFNDEHLARTIANCPVPVISAVGHEIDFTIADFVADLRAPTPSAAAEVVAQSSAELARELAHLRSRLDKAIEAQLERLRRVTILGERLSLALAGRIRILRVRLEQLLHRPVIRRPLDRIEAARQRLDEAQHRSRTSLGRLLERTQQRQRSAWASLTVLGQSIIQRYRHRLTEKSQRLDQVVHLRSESAKARLYQAAGQLRALDPTAILARGYAVVRLGDGRAVRDPAEVAPGSLLSIRVARGEFDAVAGTQGNEGVRPHGSISPIKRASKPGKSPATTEGILDLFSQTDPEDPPIE